MIVICQQCNLEFNKYDSKIKLNPHNRNYCSRTCYFSFKRSNSSLFYGKHENTLVKGRKILKRIGSKNQKSLYKYICICGKTRKGIIDDIKSAKSDECRCGDYKSTYDICLDQLYQRYKYTSPHRKLKVFDLKKEWFEKLITGNCYYCDAIPRNKITVNKVHELKYNGIDRLNNNIGYLETNCVSCCWNCNEKKKNTNKEEFLDWIQKTYYNLRDKGELK